MLSELKQPLFWLTWSQIIVAPCLILSVNKSLSANTIIVSFDVVVMFFPKRQLYLALSLSW
jgi:hypothetical protein